MKQMQDLPANKATVTFYYVTDELLYAKQHHPSGPINDRFILCYKKHLRDSFC
jgi:hypothetical protein